MQKKPSTPKATSSADNRSTGSVFFKSKPAFLYLADGITFRGQAPNWQTDTYNGEVVLNTGMTGSITNAKTARLLLRCLSDHNLQGLEPKHWREFVPKNKATVRLKKG